MSGTRQLRRIKSVGAKPGHRLAVVLDTGEEITVDLSDSITRGGVFAPLEDQKVFARVRVGDRRRTVEWPEPADGDGEPLIDIDAESLLHIASQQRGAVHGKAARAR